MPITLSLVKTPGAAMAKPKAVLCIATFLGLILQYGLCGIGVLEKLSCGQVLITRVTVRCGDSNLQAHGDRWQHHPRVESGGDKCITHSHHRCHLGWCRLAWAAGDPSGPAFSLLYLSSPLCPSPVPKPRLLAHLHQGLPPLLPRSSLRPPA